MRIHELALLRILIDEPELSELWELQLTKRYGVVLDDHSLQNVEDVLAGKFFRGDRFHIALAFNQKMEPFTMPVINAPAVKIWYKLDTPVENKLYEYITEQSL